MFGAPTGFGAQGGVDTTGGFGTTGGSSFGTTGSSPFCHMHSGLDQFKGSPEAELLAHESHQLIHDVEAALKQGLKLTAAPQTPSIMDAMPVVSLSFNRMSEYSPLTVTEADRPQILQWFVKLARHSKKLDAFPEVKVHFWATIAKTMGGHDAKNLNRQLFAKSKFPRFAIHCGRKRSPQGKWSNVNQELCDAIFDIFTATAPLAAAMASAAVPAISFALSFSQDKPELALTCLQLELIETMMDRIATHIGAVDTATAPLPYQITALDFSNNIMHAPQLEIVARMVAKCKSGFYQIEQIQLDGVIPNIDMQGPDDMPRAFLDTMCAAFHTDSLPPFWTIKPPQVLPVRQDGNAASSILRKVSFSQNVLTSNFFSRHFSALRYGCPLEEDLTEYAIESFPIQDEDSAECWRWVAFGLFYPRPKRFADKYKLRSLGKVAISPLGIRTIVNTLRNPVAQLVYNDVEGSDTTTTDSLMVCTVKQGASIEVFVSGLGYEHVNRVRRPVDKWFKTLLETSEFEALCEKEDGSVCVVVPGAGLGWVEKEFVVAIEREPLDLGRSAHDGLYHATIDAGRTMIQVSELRPLFHRIGHQLRSLTLGCPQVCYRTRELENETAPSETVVQTIHDHCVHLQHLNLNNMSAEEFSDLLVVLGGTSDFGARLLTLNLNDNYKAGHGEGVVRLATILANTTNPLALQELRLAQCSLKPEDLASLHDALLVNRTLVALELTRTSGWGDAVDRAGAARLNASFQGQLLRANSLMDTKLAFLSAMDTKFATLSGQRVATYSARDGLDQTMLTLILEFAASLETRRTILWNEGSGRGFWNNDACRRRDDRDVDAFVGGGRMFAWQEIVFGYLDWGSRPKVVQADEQHDDSDQDEQPQETEESDTTGSPLRKADARDTIRNSDALGRKPNGELIIFDRTLKLPRPESVHVDVTHDLCYGGAAPRIVAVLRVFDARRRLLRAILLLHHAIANACWRAVSTIQHELLRLCGRASKPRLHASPSSVIESLAARQGLSISPAMARVVRDCGHLSIPLAPHIMYDACRRGHLDAVMWLHVNTPYYAHRALDAAAKNRHFGIVQWLLQHLETAQCMSRPAETRCRLTAKESEELSGIYVWSVHLPYRSDVYTCCDSREHGLLPRKISSTLTSPSPLKDWAVEIGDLKLLKKIHSHTSTHDLSVSSDALEKAAERGHLPVLKWIVRHTQVDTATLETCFTRALSNGQLPVAVYIKRGFGDSLKCSPYLRGTVHAAGYLDVLHWVDETFPDLKRVCQTRGIRAGDWNCPLVQAAQAGCLEEVRSLHDHHGRGVSPLAFIDAAEQGHLEIAQWLLARLMEQTTDHGNTQLLRYLNTAVVRAACNGKLSVVQWLVEDKGRWSGDLLRHAATSDQVDVVKYLHHYAQSSAPADPGYDINLAALVTMGCFKSLEWVLLHAADQLIPQQDEEQLRFLWAMERYYDEDERALYTQTEAMNARRPYQWTLAANLSRDRVRRAARQIYLRCLELRSHLQLVWLPKWAIWTGSLDVLQALAAQKHPGVFTAANLRLLLTSTRDVGLVQWFLDQDDSAVVVQAHKTRIAQFVAKYARMELLQSLLSRYGDDLSILRTAVWTGVNHGHVTVLEFVARYLDHTKRDTAFRRRVWVSSARLALKNGHMDVLAWLCSTGVDCLEAVQYGAEAISCH